MSDKYKHLPPRVELAEALQQVDEVLSEALDPELTRVEIVRKIKCARDLMFEMVSHRDQRKRNGRVRE